MAFFAVYCRRLFLKPESSAIIPPTQSSGHFGSSVPQSFALRRSLSSEEDVFFTQNNKRNSGKMVLNELTTAGFAAQTAVYLPHLIFFLYKIGQSVFSPSTKLYLYSSICSDRYGDAPFQLPQQYQQTFDLDTTTRRQMKNQQQHSLGGKGRPHLNHSTSLYTEVGLRLTSTSTLPRNLTTTCQDMSGADEDVIQMEAADYIMAMKILQDVPAFLLGMFCGGWSDRVGRRLPMMLPCIGGLIVTMIFVFIQIGGGIAIPGILFGVALNSFTGRNTLVSMAVQAYVTDQSSEQERTRQLGRILAMNFFGLFGGSFIMALLADRVPFWVIFLCVAVFYGAALALIYFALPESKLPGQVGHHGHYPAPKKTLSSSSSLNFHSQEGGVRASGTAENLSDQPLLKKLVSCLRWDNFTDTLSTITRERPNNMRRYLIVAYICIVLHNMCKSGEIDVLLLFVKHTPLNWTKSGYGYLLSFQYATVGLLLIFVLPFLLNTLRLSDSAIIIGCVVTKAFGLSILAFSDRSWMVFLSNIFVSTFGMIISCLRSIVSKMVDEDETGRCFAIISSSETVSDLFGVVFFTRLYYIGLSYPNGRPLPFIVMAGVHIILLALALYIKHGIKYMSGEGAMNAGGYDELIEETPDNNIMTTAHIPPHKTLDLNASALDSVSSVGADDDSATSSATPSLRNEDVRSSINRADGYGAFQQQQQSKKTTSNFY